MAITRQKKEEILRALVDKLSAMKSAVFLSYERLTVHEMEEFRKILRESGSRFLAAKRTLIERALKERGVDVDLSVFPGGLAIAFGLEDEIAPAKSSHEFAKKHEPLVIHGGMLVENNTVRLMTKEQVTSLAKLPGKQQLLAQLVGTIRAPLSGLLNVFSGNQRALVQVLQQIKESKV